MNVLRRLPVPALLVAAACATAPTAPQTEQPVSCEGFVAARLSLPKVPEYPAPARIGRMSGESTHDVVVDRSGNVADVQIVGTTFMSFAQAADAALRGSKYLPATLDGRPVASRFWARVPFGVPKDIETSPARNRVTAFVPGSEPPKARWQLAGGVDRVAVVADVASAPPGEVSVVAIAPDGAERVLLEPRAGRPTRILESVRTGGFFAKPGLYRIALRHGERPIAQGAFLVAEDEASAIVNACGAP